MTDFEEARVAMLVEAFKRVADALIDDENLHETDDNGDVCEGYKDQCACELPALINSTLAATAADVERWIEERDEDIRAAERLDAVRCCVMHVRGENCFQPMLEVPLAEHDARVRRESEQAFYGGLALSFGVDFDVDSVGSSVVEKIRSALHAKALEEALQSIVNVAPPTTIVDHGARQAWARGLRDAADAIRALASPAPATTEAPTYPDDRNVREHTEAQRATTEAKPNRFALCIHDVPKHNCPDCAKPETP
jgi:hypothetical protein